MGGVPPVSYTHLLDRVSGRKVDERSRVGEENDPEQDAVQVADSAAGPDRLLLSSEIGALQQSAMQSLTATEQTAFVLRHMEDCSTEEILSLIHISMWR